MENPPALALFVEIVARTKEGRIPWEPTVSDALVAAIKGKRSLLLMPYTSKDSWGNLEGGPSLIVKDSADRELLRVTSQIQGVRLEALEELYEIARRQAFKVDEQVKDLLSDLRSL
jgi:hypothetical protein